MKFQAFLCLLAATLLSTNLFKVKAQSGLEICFRYTLQKVRNESKVPALGGVLVYDGKIQAAGATGVRKEGTNALVTDNDRFPIGSISKTFTGLVVAKAIQNSAQVILPPQVQEMNPPLSWNTKIKDVFPTLAQDPTVNPFYLEKSLAELTTHQAGFPKSGDESSNCPKDNFVSYMFCGRNLHMVKNLKLTPAPEVDYSNVGPVIAANMIQNKTNKIWEQLVSDYIYTPLQMSAGFISTYDYNAINDPMFHSNDGVNNIPIPYTEGDKYNVAAPAGHIAISAKDMGKYLVELMPGAPGRAGILNNINLQLYLSKLNNNRNVTRGGWIVTNASWAPNQQVLWHNGSHGKNYAQAWLVPGGQFGFCSMTNVQGSKNDIGVEAVNRMNDNLKLMYLNRNLLGFYHPQLGASNFQVNSSTSNAERNLFNDNNLNDRELASKWRANNYQAWMEVAVSAQSAIQGLMLFYAGNSHNIKEIQIYSVNAANQEILLHKGSAGTYRNIYQFNGGSLQGSKLRIRLVNKDNKLVEVNEIMVVQSSHPAGMQQLNSIPLAEKTTISVPLNKTSN